jgi:hypothetical protein
MALFISDTCTIQNKNNIGFQQFNFNNKCNFQTKNNPTTKVIIFHVINPYTIIFFFFYDSLKKNITMILRKSLVLFYCNHHNILIIYSKTNFSFYFYSITSIKII